MKTKVYVVTGATSGIGKALVEKLAVENVVFAGYRSESKGMELGRISDNIYPFYVDYAKPETIKDAINFVKSKTDKVDTLVNIAGCVVAGPVEKVSINELRKQFDVNVFGHIEITQGLIELLNDGKIINISSMSSFGIFPFISPYCASKRCLDMFFNSLLIENKSNLKIVSIKPGVIATPLWDKSVRENSKLIDKCEGYEEEMNFIARNALKNETKGLSVDKVVDLILKIDSTKNPRLSYLLGKDAVFASLLSKLPQSLVNKIVKFGLKSRMKSL